MQCKHCGSEWKTNARTNVIIRCPFCNAELEQEKENKLTFQNAKEALRYIIKTYGVDVIFDGLQLKTALDEFIPDLKQERKVFQPANEGRIVRLRAVIVHRLKAVDEQRRTNKTERRAVNKHAYPALVQSQTGHIGALRRHHR